MGTLQGTAHRIFTCGVTVVVVARRVACRAGVIYLHIVAVSVAIIPVFKTSDGIILWYTLVAIGINSTAAAAIFFVVAVP